MSLGDRSVRGHVKSRFTAIALAVAVVAAAYLTTGILLLLWSSGYTTTRLAFVTLVVAIAWTGVAGTVFDRPPVVFAAAVALLLLGFWQAVLWVFMLPTALGLVLAGVVLVHLV